MQLSDSQTKTEKQLDSWKSIAEYLQRDIRTVQRWEKNANLPVRRLRRDGRPTVSASSDELDAWLRSRSESAAPTPPPPRLLSRRVVLVGAAALGALVAGVVVSLDQGDDPPSVFPRPLTVEPGINWGPRLSPEGGRVAYTRQLSHDDPVNVVIRALADGSETVVNATPLHEYSPAWAPSGAELAFLRRDQSGLADVVVVSLTDFEERRIARIRAPAFGAGNTAGASQLDWSPDGRHLLLPERESETSPFRTALVEIATGRRRLLTDPKIDGSHETGDLRPRWSPDGRRFLVTQRFSDTRTELVIFDFDHENRAASPRTFRFEQEAPDGVNLRGTAWTPDGSRILFSAQPAGKPESRIWQISSREFSAAEPLLAGGIAAHSLDVREDREGRWPLVYVDQGADVDIVQIPLILGPGGPRPGPQAAWTPIADSLTNDNRPAVSPDGSRIAFTSPRSGSNQIWVADLRTGETSQVTNLSDAQLGHKIWSPDGERIVFILFGAKGRDLMSVRVSDGRTRLLVADDEHEWPVGYSADGRTFYYAKGPANAKTLWSIDGATGTPAKVLDARAQGFGLNPAGGYVYKVEDRFYSLAGPEAEPAFLFSQRLWDTTSFVVAKSGVYCLSNDHRLLYHGFDDGVTRILIRFREPPRPGIAVSPNEDFVYVDMLSRRMQITAIEDIRGLF